MIRLPHRTHKRMSVRAQMIADFLIAAALVGALVGINASNGFDSARRSAVARVTAETERQAESLHYDVASVPDLLKSLVSQGAIRSVRAVRCTTALRAFAELTSSAHVVIVEPDGRIACSDGSLRKVRTLGGAPWVAKAVGAPTGIGGPVPDPTAQRADVWYSMRYRATDGRVVTLIGMGAVRTLIYMERAENIDPFLVNLPSGTVLSAPKPTPRMVGSSFDRATLHHMLDLKHPLTLTGADGVKRILAGRRIAGTSWAVVAGMPYHAAMAPGRRDLNRNVIIGSLIVIVLLALGFLMHRRITTPLHRLRRAMTHVGADSVGTRAPVSGPAEFQALAEAFNEMLDARARSEERFRSLARYDSDFVTVVNADGYITYANPRAAEAFAIDVNEGAPVAFIELVEGGDRNHVVRLMDDWKQTPGAADDCAEFRLVTHTGDTRFVEANVQNLIDDPSVEGMIITCGDMTERKAAEDRLTHAALHDSLTGLPNRPLVMDRLEHVLERSRRDGTLSAVLFLDLDSFKLINDTAGHGTGDALLMQVAERLSARLRPGDTLGRFGGDEFVIICDSLASVADATTIAERLIATREEPYLVNGQEIYIGGSIGIASARPEDTASSLLRDADVAMYRAKAAGRGSVCVFDDAMRVATYNRLDIENALQRAIERGELSLHYQPLLALDDNRPVSLEALLRWTTADGTMVPPGEFISVAEETGLIVSIGSWVLDEGCRQLAEWTRDGDVPADLGLAVNVSARQLIQPGFPAIVAGALDRHGVAAERLIIEITESTVMRDAVTSIACLSELRALGVRISVDDFGTGYSSLGYLQRLPIDELKVDRAFVSPLSSGARAASIVESIVSLGHALGLTVIAEGVETGEQLRRLRRIGCDVAQGFLFARPMPADRLPDWLRIAEGLRERHVDASA